MSFDCEFTGLRGSGIKEDWGDTPEKRYEKLRRVRYVDQVYCADPARTRFLQLSLHPNTASPHSLNPSPSPLARPFL